MRRSASPLSLVLLGLGVFLLVLAPMLTWYVEPRAQRTPVDVVSTTVLTGTGSHFDQEDVETKDGQRLTVTRRVLGNVAESERNGVAVWDVSQTIDTPKTAKLNDPRRSFQWETERWVTDPATNRPVHCCGEAPQEFGGEAYLKFPFDVQERSYTWWDGTLGGTVPLRYAGRAEVQGYEGLRFTGSVEQVRVGSRQVPGLLVGKPDAGQVQAEEWYANEDIDLVVDQRTGRILRVSIAPKVTLRAPGGERDEVTLLRSDKLEFTEATQREQVELASADSRKLQVVGETAPIGAAAAGAVLAPLGAVLVVRGRPRSGTPHATGSAK
ncbi:DUF3068 domain-containing protein [Streptomyces sp. DSM 42041]|uniref:DUF3068 domain-containing protein n=1 Tax=Streptomyces hazeniae TaxID=3075538 RepID=A0ABU2NKA3_9ACTN|nr:DUF3068 domain-containing protein [Streptomyces sp. DSM 42041]MDT0377353.1 DUF3068 domain-containing protein [Streptomyces sp. DSM 42041]